MRRFVSVLLAGFVFLPSAVPAQAAEARVFAAASLTDAMDALVAGFEDRTGHTLTIVPASSSTLARQILAGAPADLYISANEAYAGQVIHETGAEGRDLFGNSLAIIAPDASDGEITLADLSEALGDRRLAVGDPAHVPAGIYAREALINAGLWETLEDRLAPASDVRGAVAYVAQGAAPLGIAYRTDAHVDGVRIAGTVPGGLHAPIRYWSVTLSPDNEAASGFLAYIESDAGTDMLRSMGFETGDR